MNSKQILVIAIVAVVVVAGAAVAIIISGESGKANRSYDSGTAGCLQVYGNANNDYYIDNKDVELIEKIVKENLAWAKDYPFADANYDSKVNEDDIAFTKAIVAATPEKKAEAKILCFTTDRMEGYVETVKVPVTAASFNYNTTTMVALEIMGIVDEFVATVANASPSVEPVIAENYKKFLDYKIGNRSCDVDASLAANYINGKEDPLTLFLFSNANTYDYYNVRPALNNIGISVVTVNDSSANPLEYASCMLALGFMFGTESNKYMEKAAKIAEWLYDFNDHFSKIIDKTNASGFEKKKAVVTSSVKRVSGPQSSNTKNLAFAGLAAALTPENTAGIGTGNTLNYDYESQTWLNSIDVDICIMLSSAYTDDWQWFVKNKNVPSDKVPSNVIDGIKQYSTMKNYKNTICTSLSYPSPFRNMALCEIAYPDLFVNEKGAKEYMQDFFAKFAGWDAKQFDNVDLYATPQSLGLI